MLKKILKFWKPILILITQLILTAIVFANLKITPNFWQINFVCFIAMLWGSIEFVKALDEIQGKK